jgi:hypothetical protein
LGLFEENGPFRANEYSNLSYFNGNWNRLTNILYLESPAFVGFSYWPGHENEFTKYSDESTAEGIIIFLIWFFFLFFFSSFFFFFFFLLFFSSFFFFFFFLLFFSSFFFFFFKTKFEQQETTNFCKSSLRNTLDTIIVLLSLLEKAMQVDREKNFYSHIVLSIFYYYAF